MPSISLTTRLSRQGDAIAVATLLLESGGNALGSAHGNDVDRKPFLDLHIDQPIYEDFSNLVGVIDVDDGTHVDPVRIVSFTHIKRRCREVRADKLLQLSDSRLHARVCEWVLWMFHQPVPATFWLAFTNSRPRRTARYACCLLYTSPS